MIDLEKLKYADIEVANSKLTDEDKKEISEFLKEHRAKLTRWRAKPLKFFNYQDSLFKLMKSIGIIAVLILAGTLASCNVYSTAGSGELLSDGYASYSVNGTSFIAHDSLTAGDPGNYELSSFDLDSTLQLSAPWVVISVAHCVDTGTYILSQSTTGFSYATILFRDTVYITDSLHTGILHLTQFDQSAHRLAGTFTFFARAQHGTETDTVRVLSGALYDFPLNRN